MKVLFDHNDPFLLMHGGFQVQIEQSIKAVSQVGVETEHLRWWDAEQRGDIIHYFGRPPLYYVRFAHQKGMKVVMTNILTGLGSRAGWLRMIQKAVTRSALALLPEMATVPFGWTAMREVDAALQQTSWEAHLMSDVFGVERSKVHVIVNGTEDVFLNSRPAARGPWLVCTGVITERKRMVELAEAAVTARTPVWVVGKPYSESDPYALRFMELARLNPKFVRYEGPVQDRARLAEIYREVRGFVLLSTKETLSLAAAEAAACQAPLLLSDLPWARDAFGTGATYCAIAPVGETAAALRKFYDAAPTLPPPPKPPGWVEVARQFKAVYEDVLRTSR
jgi:glycosyltransferase involved in cell wall biosynthesis